MPSVRTTVPKGFAPPTRPVEGAAELKRAPAEGAAEAAPNMPPPKAGAADVGVDVAPKSEDCSSDCESNESVFRDTLGTLAAYHGVLYLVALLVSTTHPYLSSPARALGMQGVCCCRLSCKTGLENGPFRLNPLRA